MGYGAGETGATKGQYEYEQTEKRQAGQDYNTPGQITLGGRKFTEEDIGQLSDYEREYMYQLSDRARGSAPRSLARKQLERNIGMLSGAQTGVARAQHAYGGAAALRAGQGRGEQVQATGQEQLGVLDETEKQKSADLMQGQLLQRIAQKKTFDANEAVQDENRKWGLIGKGLSALTTIGTTWLMMGAPPFSDERLKKNISVPKGEKEADKMLSEVSAINYDMFGRNETSVSAQDLEKTEAGRDMVRRGPAGLRVIDEGQAIKKMLAAMALLHKKNKSMEGEIQRLSGKKGKG